MNAAAALALQKYNAGRHSALALIAGPHGWTPGNRGAAANVARAMGLDPGADMHLDSPAMMHKFLRGLAAQELGPRGTKAYFSHIQEAVAARHGDALRHMFGHPHQQRQSMVPPHGGQPMTLNIRNEMDGRLVSKHVERHIVRRHQFAHGTADHDGRAGIPAVDSASNMG
jgi:hypothetical protein